MDEELLVQALEFAHREMQPILELQEAMARELAKPKMAWTPPEALSQEEKEAFYRLALERGLSQVLQTASKGERSRALSAFAEAWWPSPAQRGGRRPGRGQEAPLRERL